MINNIIEDKKYKDIVAAQIKEVLEYLIGNEEEFAITANIKGVKFTPELPTAIRSHLAPYSLFVLSNYTFESIEIDKENIYFEAGFGKENFGSLVTIPFYAIFQIIVNESILFVNPVATVEKFFHEEDQQQRSMNVFKNNPKNSDLFS